MTELVKPKNALTNEQVAKLLVHLKTPAMAECFLELVSKPIYQDFTLADCVSIMATRECDSRAEKRVARYLQRSGLKELEAFNQADIDKGIFSPERNLKVRDLCRLLTCEWIRDAHNVLINGPTGTGKTWVMALLGKQACLNSLRVEYHRFPKFLELLQDAREHRQTASFRAKLSLCQVLMIDDFGMASVSRDSAADLLTVLEEREGHSSLAIASQLPFTAWHEYLGGDHSADAIMDRLLNTSYTLVLAGRSLRERTALTSK